MTQPMHFVPNTVSSLNLSDIDIEMKSKLAELIRAQMDNMLT